MFELKLIDLIDALSKMSKSNVLLLIVVITIIWIGFMIVKFLMDCAFKWIKPKILKPKQQSPNEFMRQSIDITDEIRGLLSELREKMHCNAVRVWQYTNGQRSINNISFLYQEPCYESLEAGGTSIMAQCARIPITTTPATAKHFFLEETPLPMVLPDTDGMNYADFPDVLIFRGYHIKSSALCAIQCHKLTAGYIACSWLHEKKQTPFTPEEAKLINDTAIRIGILFEVLESINKQKHNNPIHYHDQRKY